MKSKEEFCIMPDDEKYSTKRTLYFNERHEVFYGKPNRQKSIKDGLIIFLDYEQHRGTYGVHGREGKTFNTYLKKIGQQVWQDYYNKTKDDFIKEYGKSYI